MLEVHSLAGGPPASFPFGVVRKARVWLGLRGCFGCFNTAEAKLEGHSMEWRKGAQARILLGATRWELDGSSQSVEANAELGEPLAAEKSSVLLQDFVVCPLHSSTSNGEEIDPSIQEPADSLLCNAGVSDTLVYPVPSLGHWLLPPVAVVSRRAVHATPSLSIPSTW